MEGVRDRGAGEDRREATMNQRNWISRWLPRLLAPAVGVMMVVAGALTA
jgi:hypothetical protein